MHGLQTHHVCLDNFDSVLFPFIQSRPDQWKTIWGDGMVNSFAGSSIGLAGIAMVFNDSPPLAKRSIVSDGINGWKATIGANEVVM